MHAQLREHPKNHRVYTLNGGVWYVTYLNKVVFKKIPFNLHKP